MSTSPPGPGPGPGPGAKARFDAVYGANAIRVLAYSLRHTDPDSAHDVVADVFLVAWRRIDDVPDEPLPWLLVVARNTLANRRRTRIRRDQLEQRLADVASVGSQFTPAAEEVALERASMLRALSELTDVEREALLLVAWDGLTARGAALVVGCSRNAFEVRLRRARLRLERSLGGSSPPGSPAPVATHPVLREART